MPLSSDHRATVRVADPGYVVVTEVAPTTVPFAPTKHPENPQDPGETDVPFDPA